MCFIAELLFKGNGDGNLITNVSDELPPVAFNLRKAFSFTAGNFCFPFTPCRFTFCFCRFPLFPFLRPLCFKFGKVFWCVFTFFFVEPTLAVTIKTNMICIRPNDLARIVALGAMGNDTSKFVPVLVLLQQNPITVLH